MMGHILNLLLKFVESQGSEADVTTVLNRAELGEKTYRPEVIYSEEEFQLLYTTIKEHFGVEDQVAQEAFAEYFMQVSPELFPAIFEIAGSARNLLEQVPNIHRQWPSAASFHDFTEKVTLVESTEERVLYQYKSQNQLCRLLVRVSELVLEHYKEEGVVHELACTLNGADQCEVEICFGKARRTE